jgi:ElaA protein
LKITVFKYQDLSPDRLYEILKLRSEVFVVEQKCAYQDLDNKDEKALHLVGEENNKIIAYTRIFKKGDFFKYSSIGRVLVKKDYRNKNYGRKIMKSSIDRLKKDPKEEKIELSAQNYLLKFYSELGFEKVGEEYLEDNIPHVKMILKI